MGPIWDAELRVWDAKNFGLVSPGTHRNKFVKKSLIGTQELDDSCQIMELNESTLELESENSSKNNSEPFLGAGRASETKWIAQ